jgi:hypothetical protein
MMNPRALRMAIWALVVLLLVTLGWSGYLLFQNYWWKHEATRYAESSARLEAHGMFRKSIFCLYKIDGQCDEEHFSGQREGPFEIWIAFYQPSLGRAHRYLVERWVATFNDQMRLMQREPEKFRKRMGLNKEEAYKSESK